MGVDSVTKTNQIKPGVANIARWAEVVIVAGPQKVIAVVSVGVHRMVFFGASTC
jgi:hypothetical protein